MQLRAIPVLQCTLIKSPAARPRAPSSRLSDAPARHALRLKLSVLLSYKWCLPVLCMAGKQVPASCVHAALTEVVASGRPVAVRLHTCKAMEQAYQAFRPAPQVAEQHQPSRYTARGVEHAVCTAAPVSAGGQAIIRHMSAWALTMLFPRGMEVEFYSSPALAVFVHPNAQPAARK